MLSGSTARRAGRYPGGVLPARQHPAGRRKAKSWRSTSTYAIRTSPRGGPTDR